LTFSAACENGTAHKKLIIKTITLWRRFIFIKSPDLYSYVVIVILSG
jgi:hypothetical protein